MRNEEWKVSNEELFFKPFWEITIKRNKRDNYLINQK